MSRAGPAVAALVLGAGGLTGLSVAGAQTAAGGGSGSVGPGRVVTAGPGTTTPGGRPTGTPAQQTHPSVRPRAGSRRSRFVVRLTLREEPGQHGVLATAYRIQVERPAGTRVACAAPAPAPITGGAQGVRRSVALPSPRPGWCRGAYTVSVLLERGPYCPAGTPPRPCPEFASQELGVGRVRFAIGAAAG